MRSILPRFVLLPLVCLAGSAHAQEWGGSAGIFASRGTLASPGFGYYSGPSAAAATMATGQPAPAVVPQAHEQVAEVSGSSTTPLRRRHAAGIRLASIRTPHRGVVRHATLVAWRHPGPTPSHAPHGGLLEEADR